MAKKKIYPTLWYLYKESLIPEHTLFVGYARSALDVHKLKESTEKYLQFRDDADRARLDSFWALNHFVQGSYDQPDDFKELDARVSQLEAEAHVAADSCGNTCEDCNRLFYLALPPSVFQSATELIKHHCWSERGFNRVIIEKPFGRDLDSAIELNRHVESVFRENEIYRIDHYLGTVKQPLFSFSFSFLFSFLFFSIIKKRQRNGTELNYFAIRKSHIFSNLESRSYCFGYDYIQRTVWHSRPRRLFRSIRY